MNELRIIIGRESSEDEINAVSEAFQLNDIKVFVDPSLMRMSGDPFSLPMTIMIFAQAMAPNVVWNLIKYGAVKIFGDKRLKDRRSTAVVIKREMHEVIVTSDKIFARSGMETQEFSSYEDLVKYEQAVKQSSDKKE